MKRKVLIITLNDYIIYQPSILNLYDFLIEQFDVTVVSFKPERETKKKDEIRNIVYLSPNYLLKHVIHKTDFVLANINKHLVRKIKPDSRYARMYYNKYLPQALRSFLKNKRPQADIIIAVDLPALHVVQQIYGSVHFLSLEIENNTNPIHQKIDRSKVKSVFIQSKERYDYLFPGLDLPTFYIQNAPVFKEESITNYERKDFIWAGAINYQLAIFECLNFFDRYPQFTLVLKGGGPRKTLQKIKQKYAHLIVEKRIMIDQSYLPASSFLDFLSHFKYGFSFYSPSLVADSFNYATAPSGKLFMSFAAGIPVIASNIPGFKLVKEFHAGVLIDDYSPENILKATELINADYAGFQEGCYNTARHFSFDKAVAPYLEFLKTSQ